MLKGGASKVSGGVMDGLGISREAAEKIKGFGFDRGADTPAKREELAFDSDNGVMDLATNYKNTNATQADYDTKMSYIDSAPALGGLNTMRTLQNLGIGETGLDTSAERKKLSAIMGMSAHPDKMASFMETGILPEGYLQKYGVGAKGLDTLSERQFLENSFAGTGQPEIGATPVNREDFNTNFANLTPDQQANVTDLMSNMTDEQRALFAQGMVNKLGGYEVQSQGRLGQGY